MKTRFIKGTLVLAANRRKALYVEQDSRIYKIWQKNGKEAKAMSKVFAAYRQEALAR